MEEIYRLNEHNETIFYTTTLVFLLLLSFWPMAFFITKRLILI